jgi:tetratricopeptide (TPR) repeat protein
MVDMTKLNLKEETMNMKKKLTLLCVSFIIVVFMLNFSGCGKIKASHLKANYYLKKANKYYAEEMYKWAAEEYEAALKLNPDLKFVYAYLGTSYSSLYRPMKDDEKNKMYSEKAIEYLLKAREFEPENDKIIVALGDIYEKMGNMENAEKYFREILAKNPSDPNTYYLLAQFYTKNGKHDSAERMYQKRIGLNPEDPDGYHYYVGFLQDQRRWKDAIDNHEKRLYAMLDPGIILILNEIAQLQSDTKEVTRKKELNAQLKNKIEQAEATIKTFDPEKKQEVAEVYYSIGHVCWNWSYQTPVDFMSPQERNGIIEKGLKNLKKAIEIVPDYPNPYAYIGLLYREKIKVDPLKRDEFVALNEKYNKKFIEIHQRKKRSEEYRKQLEEMGK